MVLEKKEIQELMKKYGRHEKDSGSPEFQVAYLTKRINYLTDHLKKHKKDNHTRRGLLKLVGQRKRILSYLEKKDIDRYRSLKKELGIR